MNANQGLYKFKNEVRPKVYDRGTKRDTIVRLTDNYSMPAYSYINSVAGDMIKSIGMNLSDVSAYQYHASSSTYTIDVQVSSDGEITLDTAGTKKTSNSAVCSGWSKIKIDRPCTAIIRLNHISGRSVKANNPETELALGLQVGLCDDTEEWSRTIYSINSDVAAGSVVFRTFEITQEDINNGASILRIRPWANGTTGGGSIFDNYKYTMMVWITDSDSFNEFDYEPYVETTKVCDQNGHCYCMAYPKGTLYSLKGNEIGVNYAKSEFAFNFRALLDRVQNIDGADISSENRKVLFFGDSITAGSGASQLYHMWLSRLTGFKCLNYGIGGGGYIREDFANAYTGNGNEGRGDITQHDGNNTVIKIMQSVGDFENCVIFAGTNDYGISSTLADFRTAVQNTLDYAQTKASRIFVITPTRRTNGETVNQVGAKLSEYGEIIIEECASRGIPCIDGYSIPMNPENSQSKGWYYSAGDGLHPSNNGHKFMAGWILDKFKAVFKV